MIVSNKIIIISNLFPNSIEPTRGIFNFQQIKALASLDGVEVKVIAPLPWYYRKDIEEKEDVMGIPVTHPRYFMIPKLGFQNGIYDGWGRVWP